MQLGELISYLKSKPAHTRVLHGFGKAMSYRGYYSELGFEPKDNTTVREMLAEAEKALGATYQGYKGGDFTMSEYSDCYLASYGETGDEISELVLDAMIQEVEVEHLRVRVERLEKELELGRAWPVQDVLDKLADAAQHLLQDHGCDQHGYEGAGIAAFTARRMSKAIRAALAPEKEEG